MEFEFETKEDAIKRLNEIERDLQALSDANNKDERFVKDLRRDLQRLERQYARNRDRYSRLFLEKTRIEAEYHCLADSPPPTKPEPVHPAMARLHQMDDGW